jgi:restriction system protein
LGLLGGVTLTEQLAPSRALGAKVLHGAMQVLRDNGGELHVKQLTEETERRIKLDDWAKNRYEKTGYVRWQSILHFFSIDAVKAGFLIKKKGVWYLTPEGESAIKLGEVGLLNAATKAYRAWKAEQNRQIDIDNAVADESIEEKEVTITLEHIEQIAMEELKKFVKAKNPYAFQDLAAALLRGMGYYTPFVAPRGKDGGIDIIAYRDPLGTVTPRIKVQVKHREQSATVQEIRQLMGLLQKDGDVGILISSGGFTPDAKTAAQSSHIHIELIDLDRFIGLWQEFYHKLADEDKSHLSLIPVYFLEPME